MKDFNEIYNAIYRTCNEPMEELRKNSKNSIVRIAILSVAIGILLTIMTRNPMFIMIAVVVIFFYREFSKGNKEYKNVFKEQIIKTFVKEYSNMLEFKPQQGVSSTIYLDGDFEHFDIYHSEDLITGVLNEKYRIAMSEVHTENESTDSDGGTTYTTLFHGLFAKVELDKMVNTKVKIRRNSIKLFGKGDKIEMDSSEFEKSFDVYAGNKITAMQLLTADIMQMLLDFKNQNKLTPEITLKGSALYIRFSTGDLFEPKLMKSSLDYETLKKYYDTINFTLNITEKFLKNIEETEL